MNIIIHSKYSSVRNKYTTYTVGMYMQVHLYALTVLVLPLFQIYNPPCLALSLTHTQNVNLAHPEPPVGLVMDQSLQQGLATQTESIEEELSSLVAICVMMVRRSCHQINLGLYGQLLQCVRVRVYT